MKENSTLKELANCWGHLANTYDVSSGGEFAIPRVEATLGWN
jgi:hypothetical protein